MSFYKFLKRKVFIGRNVHYGDNLHIGLMTWISANDRLTIGDDVLIGKLCTIQCEGSIGNGVMIANNVGIIGRIDHDFRKIGVRLSRAPHIADSEDLRKDSRSRIHIGDDVWIGFGSTIFSGVSIGKGAIVAAGSVVMSDVGAYDIVSGNPARRIGRRFTDEEIAAHEEALTKSTSERPERATLEA